MFAQVFPFPAPSRHAEVLHRGADDYGYRRPAESFARSVGETPPTDRHRCGSSTVEHDGIEADQQLGPEHRFPAPRRPGPDDRVGPLSPPAEQNSTTADARSHRYRPSSPLQTGTDFKCRSIAPCVLSSNRTPARFHTSANLLTVSSTASIVAFSGNPTLFANRMN